MRVVSQRKLKEYFETPGNESAKVPLERWYEIAENADWKNFADMKAGCVICYGLYFRPLGWKAQGLR